MSDFMEGVLMGSGWKLMGALDSPHGGREGGAKAEFLFLTLVTSLASPPSSAQPLPLPSLAFGNAGVLGLLVSQAPAPACGKPKQGCPQVGSL